LSRRSHWSGKTSRVAARGRQSAVTVVADIVLIAVIAVIGSAGFTVLSAQGGH
jgi:hypothetical protein